MLQMLWIEFVAKLAGGVVLLSFPLTVIKILGLPKAETAFWPRLLGAVLLGLAVATYMENSVKLGHGLGLGGSLVINLAGGLTIAALLFMKQAGDTVRGRVVLWAVSLALMGLALVEIAYI